jgi:pyruvyltransferase
MSFLPKQLRQNKMISSVAHAVRWNADYLLARMGAACGQQFITASWFRCNNWGDNLNPFLINAISGKHVQFSVNPLREKFLVIGSTIGMKDLIDDQTIVWGAGCMHADSKLFCHPKRVCAVRGPLTRDILLAHGIDTPAIYGDPALLMPRFYNPDIAPRYEIGIIPHFFDKGHEWIENYQQDSQVNIIDVQSDTYAFIEQVKQCRYIVSSSLHGIICADAYGIPAIWVEFSDKVAGEGFKFQDYFASIQRTDYQTTVITADITLSSLIDHYIPYTVRIDLDKLYEACPFRVRT